MPLNPYLSPTVMPDGSARRPIVERVPECRPKDDGTLPLTFVEGCVLKERRSGATVAEIAKKNGCTKDRVRNLLRKAEAKAVPHISILRVACEDWINSIPWVSGTERMRKMERRELWPRDGWSAVLVHIMHLDDETNLRFFNANDGHCEFGGDDGDFWHAYEGETIHHALNAAAHAVADALGVEP